MQSDIQNSMDKIDNFIKKNYSCFNQDFNSYNYLQSYYGEDFIFDPSFMSQADSDKIYETILYLDNLERGEIIE